MVFASRHDSTRHDPQFFRLRATLPALVAVGGKLGGVSGSRRPAHRRLVPMAGEGTECACLPDFLAQAGRHCA